jgi:flagellar protein FliO/FliZ
MEYVNLLGYLAALALVLALAGAALLVKRASANPSTFGQGLRAKLGGKLGGWSLAVPERRLSITETLMLGPRQRLFIVRRDQVEHLVLSTPEGATVIESGIPAPPRPLAQETPAP